jgi:cytochrome P450
MSDERGPDTLSHIPTGVELTALDPTFRADPYPVLAHLRERQPVHYDDVIKRWVLTRHDDIDRLLRDRTMAVDARKANPGTYMRVFDVPNRDREPSMLLLGGACGQVHRTARAVERLAPRIREIIDELLGPLTGQASFDLIEAFAVPLPVIVIAEMLGVDPADRDDFKRWSDLGAMWFNPLLTGDQRALIDEALRQRDNYLQHVIAERHATPRDDLISALIAVEEAGDQLNDGEILTMCGLLLAAGNVTTTDLIGNGVWTLLRHPDQLQKLRDNPSLIRNAVEEILRFESPVVQTARIPTEDVEIGGCPMHRGESVLALLAAANHDPEVYPKPDRFDITRPDVHHHSFGAGAHFCLGAPLARLEAQLAIVAIVQRFPNLHLANEPLEWHARPAFRGLARLRVLV